MIVRPRPHWFHLLFVRRGSLLHRILPQLIFTMAIAAGVMALHGQVFHWKVTLNPTPFSLMGVALAIFLGFRINASYDRYWEARKLWGAVLVESRNLARQAQTLVQAAPGPVPAEPPDADGRPLAELREFVHALIGFAHVLRNQLRELPADAATATLLPEALRATLPGARAPGERVLGHLAAQLRRWRSRGQLGAHEQQLMMGTIDDLGAALGGCERIARTPLPFTYVVILHRTVYLYCMLLPFGLVDAIGVMTPMVVGFVAYTFFALEALSDEIEEPFGRMPNDLPLDALVAGIEASLRESIGETPPPVPRPDADFLLY